MSVRLIAADMDGTLLTTDQRISDRNEEAIRKAVDAGIEFVLGTGRSDSECERYYPQLKMNYCIYANGAYVMDPVTKKEYFRKTIAPSDAKRIFDIYNSFDSVIFIQRDHWVHAKDNFRTDCLRFPEYYHDHAPIELPYIYDSDQRAFLDRGTSGIEKFHVSFMTHEDASSAYALLSELPFKTVWCGQYCVEVTHPQADKGAALLWIAGRLGISADEIMAIGDSDNDSSMVSAAGIGVAVGNASQSLKNIAEYIVPGNNEDGVAYAIENLTALL